MCNQFIQTHRPFQFKNLQTKKLIARLTNSVTIIHNDIHNIVIFLTIARRILKPGCETNLVFIHTKTEQYVIDYANSDYFTIHFRIEAFRTNGFSRPKNKKHTSKIYFR